MTTQTVHTDWRQNPDRSWTPGQARSFRNPKKRLPQRVIAEFTTATLADDATENGFIELGKAWRLMAIETSEPARLRLYADDTYRVADASRPIGTDPDLTTDHGVMLDFVTTPTLLEAVFSPLVDGFMVTGGLTPYALTNLSGGSTTVGVALTYLETE